MSLPMVSRTFFIKDGRVRTALSRQASARPLSGIIARGGRTRCAALKKTQEFRLSSGDVELEGVLDDELWAGF